MTGATRFLRILAALMILSCPKAFLFGQFPLSSPFGLPGATEVDDRTAKLELALETARVAAEAELFDVSFEAVKRVCAEGPPISKPQIQSSLLGGQTSTSTRVSSTRLGYQVPEAGVEFGSKLFAIVDKWKSKQAPSERIAEAMEQIVFPAGRPNEIVIISNLPPANANNYSYEFSFTDPKSARYIAFELIDLAVQNKTLPRIIEKLENLRTLPGSQAQAVAMLVYAKRVSGKADEAAKMLEDLLAKPVDVNNTLPLYYALTQTCPEAGEASVIPAAVSVPILNKLLKQNIMRMDIRTAILQQIKQLVKSEDPTAFEAYVAMVIDSIHQMPGGDQSSINYMLENFYRSLADECTRQGKATMAAEISSRAINVRTELGQDSVLDADRLVGFADLQPDVRLKALRKMLIERPVVKVEQFSFAEHSRSVAVPKFFQVTKPDKLKNFLPYEGAKSFSMLDLLLNQSESESNYPAVVKELLANANDNDDVKRFLAVWLNFRSEMRGKQVDNELAKLATFENEKDYIDWWKTLPKPAALELVHFRMRKEALSTEMQAALETKFINSEFDNEQPSHVLSDIQYESRLAIDKSLVNANRLKHWIVSNEPTFWQADTQPPVWTVNGKHQVECFGGAWDGQLIFRYPLPLNSTIKVTADLADNKNEGLYCGGVSLLSLQAQQGLYYAIAPNARTLGEFTAKASTPTRVMEGMFKDNSLNIKMGDKAIEVLEYDAKTVPFVGLANYRSRPSAYSEIAINVSAPLPREVSLLDKGLTGWSAGGHALPKLSGHIETDGSENQASNQEASPIWRVVDEVLQAGRSPNGNEDADTSETDTLESDPFGGPDAIPVQSKISQSNMTYSRPLCEGDRVEYEFFHQPEKHNASPSIGRIAYLIRDGKISLKWISIGSDQSKPIVESNYLGEDPAAEVLAPMKLELNAWNRLQLRIEEGKVVLAVGGTDVYRRPLEKETVARFGFYCDPQKDQVRIRNVVLKGDWPTELPQDLFELK